MCNKLTNCDKIKLYKTNFFSTIIKEKIKNRKLWYNFNKPFLIWQAFKKLQYHTSWQIRKQ